MYICLDEGHVFWEPKHYIEKHGQDSPPYEEYDGCPYCAGAFEEAEECDRCGKQVSCFEITVDKESGDRLCYACCDD